MGLKLIAEICVLAFFVSCSGQETDWINRSKHKGLFKQDLTNKFEVYSSVKTPKNITQTITLIKDSKQYYDAVFNENMSFSVMFIDKNNWNTYAYFPPPGMPQASFDGNIVLGYEKSVMATNAENRIKQAPKDVQNLMKKHFGETMDLDLFYRDALCLHEMGHLYQFYKTGKNYQRRWLNELFANICQVGAARNLKNQDVFNRMDVFQKIVLDGLEYDNLKYTSLNQFEKNYFDIILEGQNYGWYQIQFFLKAKTLHSMFGDSFLNVFRNFLITTNPEKVGKLNDTQLNQQMLNLFGSKMMAVINWENVK